jgi:cell division septation protein DedD
MATGAKRGGDMVLGGRHLVGIFVVLVVLFGVVFTLGYVLGRNHGEMQLRAAADSTPASGSAVDKSKDKERPSTATAKSAENPAPPPTDWDFYHSAEPNSPSGRLVQQPKSVSVPKESVGTVPTVARRPPAKQQKPAPSSSRGGLNAPLIARGSTVLQVAALVRQGDALALAQALQQKKFPAFVMNPSDDNYYRVQVGPYASVQAANLARKRLESQGFNSIVKR